MKVFLKWCFYVFLFLVAGGLIEKGPEGAIGVLAAVVGWSFYKLHRVAAEIRDALDRLGRAAGARRDVG